MKQHSFIVLNVVPPHTRLSENEKVLTETISLIRTLTQHTRAVTHVVQQKMRPDPTTYIGAGKVAEIGELIKTHTAVTVIINDIVKPMQVYDLYRLLWKSNPSVQVWDRADLILQIFKKHAKTAEANLQIELAAMQHMGPRMYGLGNQLSRQGGGIGTRGIGETNTQRMKRHWKAEMAKVVEKLKKRQSATIHRMQKRKEQNVFTVAIVGYTNAGKTSLFNALTGKQNYAKNALFATLDSATGYLKPSTAAVASSMKRPILISDTIGFIQNLPPQLIQAFRSTMLETVHADLLLHVVDATDPALEEKIDTVKRTLIELSADTIPVLTVFTKSDLPPHASIDQIRILKTVHAALLCSVQDASSITALQARILQIAAKS